MHVTPMQTSLPCFHFTFLFPGLSCMGVPKLRAQQFLLKSFTSFTKYYLNVLSVHIVQAISAASLGRIRVNSCPVSLSQPRGDSLSCIGRWYRQTHEKLSSMHVSAQHLADTWLCFWCVLESRRISDSDWCTYPLSLEVRTLIEKVPEHKNVLLNKWGFSALTAEKKNMAQIRKRQSPQCWPIEVKTKNRYSSSSAKRHIGL